MWKKSAASASLCPSSVSSAATECASSLLSSAVQFDEAPQDGILTCHWHHARFDLASGCTFDLWADDVPTCPVELRDGEVWVKPSFGYGDAASHWRGRLDDGLAHNLDLVIAKAMRSQLTAGVPAREILRQAALFAVQNSDGESARPSSPSLATCSPCCRTRRPISRSSTAPGGRGELRW